VSDDENAKPDRPIARGAKKALLAPVNLGVAGAAAVGAAALGSLPLLALGAATYAALVAWDLSSPSFWRKVVGTAPSSAAALPLPHEVFDAETRLALERVQRARAAIAAVVAGSRSPASSPLAGVLPTVDELDHRVGRLVVRSDELSRYLAASDADALRADVEQLAGRARSAPDAEVRRHYEEARVAREDQLRTLGDIAAARERLVANLARIAATLDGIPAKLMKMHALDGEATDDLSGDVGRELGEMNMELKAFEETLETLVEERA
jgi:hypothetical protein